MITPKLIAQPNRFHAVANPVTNPNPPMFLPSTGTSPVWSGLVVYQDARLFAAAPLLPYFIVSGAWYVPSVTGEPDIQDDSAFWVGMDGWDGPGANDVLQGGTEQQAFTFVFLGTQFTITNYYAWGEFFPFSEQLISNFPVSPGDYIVGQVIGIEPGLDSGSTGPGGTFFIQNFTAGTTALVHLFPPKGTNFHGNTAEWIMERPLVNNSVTDLSNYAAASMFTAYASRADFSVVNAAGNSESLNVTMVNANKTPLSEVLPLNDYSMAFRWLGFK
jgi:hypothetical protein